MFEVVKDESTPHAVRVRGSGGFEGQWAIFSGPGAPGRAEAYARWMNAGGAHQRRRSDPGFKASGAADPVRKEDDAPSA